jgi:toxin HigB-1
MAICGFANEVVRQFFFTGHLNPKVGWHGVARIVARKLDLVHYAGALSDLNRPPGNRLEALKRNLTGFHSIRVNDQWRVVFRWTPAGPIDVDVRDYH